MSFHPLIQAVLLGIVEGLTEFIPVSSTGHLILFGKAIAFEGEAASTFEIFIQLGAILAVVYLYPKRFLSLLDFKSGDGFSGMSGLIKLFLACLPAFVFGFLFHSTIKEILFAPLPVAFALIVGGIAFFLVDTDKRQEKVSALSEISYLQSFLIGVFQCAALWPGMSRSGSTILGGLLLGLHRKIAAEFSFLVAVPVMTAAVGYDLFKSAAHLGAIDWQVFGLGFFVSFVTAIAAVKFFVSLLGRYTLRPFGAYRIVLGLIVLYFLW